MNFGEAIEHLKKGRHVARMGWNGKGMYLYMVVPSDRYQRQYIAMKDAQDMYVPWLASQTDMLAEDWLITL